MHDISILHSSALVRFVFINCAETIHHNFQEVRKHEIHVNGNLI